MKKECLQVVLFMFAGLTQAANTGLPENLQNTRTADDFVLEFLIKELGASQGNDIGDLSSEPSRDSMVSTTDIDSVLVEPAVVVPNYNPMYSNPSLTQAQFQPLSNRLCALGHSFQRGGIQQPLEIPNETRAFIRHDITDHIQTLNPRIPIVSQAPNISPPVDAIIYPANQGHSTRENLLSPKRSASQNFVINNPLPLFLFEEKGYGLASTRPVNPMAPVMMRNQLQQTSSAEKTNIPPSAISHHHPRIPPPTAAPIDNSSAIRMIAAGPSIDPRTVQPICSISLVERKVPAHAILPSFMKLLQANANHASHQSMQRSGTDVLPTTANNRSAANQPLAPHSSLLEQTTNSSSKVDWFHGPVATCSNWMINAPRKWPFSFRDQFVLAPSYVDINQASHGISGMSDQFSFVVRPGFIALTEGHRKDFTDQYNSYNKGLVKAIKTSELESKKRFGIELNGLCAILETVEHRDGVRVYLHVRAIGQLPVALKVMRRIENRWVAISSSKKSNGLTSYEIMKKDVIIIGEPAELEQKLPVTSHDLFGDLKATADSSFHFLILAQLVGLKY